MKMPCGAAAMRREAAFWRRTDWAVMEADGRPRFWL